MLTVLDYTTHSIGYDPYSGTYRSNVLHETMDEDMYRLEFGNANMSVDWTNKHYSIHNT